MNAQVAYDQILNLFYEEPDPDRWFPGDRYPRRVVRRLVRGKPLLGGQARVFLNLCAGLDRLGVRYRVNDYHRAMRYPEELVCIVGKPCVLDKMDWQNPILFGASGYSHPIDDARLLERRPVRKVLVPGPWYESMCKPYWREVEAWPVGIDIETWAPGAAEQKTTDVLLYDKVRWDRDRYTAELINPIRRMLQLWGFSIRDIRYGNYYEEEFLNLLKECRAMIFLCEHETQGIAYQQALSCGVPLAAWDRGGAWQDPAYYPHKVVFAPVTSVPYWDDRCGLRFADANEFALLWPEFWNAVERGSYRPRDYIEENLTLENCAQRYVEIAKTVRDF